jgi:hypothetical protein
MTDQTWFDLPPETTVELIAASPLLDLGYKPAEVAIRRRRDDFTLIGILIAKPRPSWLLEFRLWRAEKGL